MCTTAGVTSLEAVTKSVIPPGRSVVDGAMVIGENFAGIVSLAAITPGAFFSVQLMPVICKTIKKTTDMDKDDFCMLLTLWVKKR
jgi:hypothetical protein